MSEPIDRGYMSVTYNHPTTSELDYLQRHRVGRLVTVPPDGLPSAVPCCFAVMERDGAPVIVSALDRKPKSVEVRELARVRNIAAHPRVSLLVDDYSEDWTQLGFMLVHGIARVLDGGSQAAQEAIERLREKYPQYREMDLDDAPAIEIGMLHVASWSAAGSLDGRPDDLQSLVRGRRSVRSFLPEPVPAGVVRSAIETAGWAPSPHGRQPWRFAVVERPERRAGLAEAMAATWDEQLRLDGQDEEIVRIRLEKSKQRLIEAPVLVIPCLYLADLDVYPDAGRQAAEEIMAIQSLGSAVQNFLLSIYAAGFDAGWMCAPLFCPEVVRDYLGLDERLTPHALLPVGRAAKDPVRRPRRPVDELIVDWD
ncbi:MAG TPA: TIGR03668 family PPOX class F420-dependent oxidoreductase [Thermomicrobiales bacterium]|nr:TIGR03668 family PPOX class F420-dependent oxidoreductase [Thermomicrobiales bacterium]